MTMTDKIIERSAVVTAVMCSGFPHSGVCCATEIIARHIERKTGEQKPGVCAICGMEREETMSLARAGSSFNNFDLLRYPSNRLCVYCVSCMCNRLRFTNFTATEQALIEFKRDGIIEHLFNPPNPPFVFCITRSYKKQNAIRARVNYSKEQFHIRIEDEELLFEPEKAKPVHADLERLLGIFSKTEIASGNYRPKRIEEFGMERLLAMEQQIASWRSHPMFDLLLYALIDQKQRKEEKNARREPATDLFS